MKKYIMEPQWYVATVIGGKEDSIIETIKERLTAYGYDEFVPEIKVIRQLKQDRKVFENPDDLPKSIKDTKTAKWEVLPNGKYAKITSKIVNKYPGYIYIKMIYDQNVWYLIRNTQGVMGFIGSSGKGAKPLPISNSEYEKLLAGSIGHENGVSETLSNEPILTEAAKIFETNLAVGMEVTISHGAFTGSKGIIKSINLANGTATVSIEFFGREQVVEVELDHIRE